VGVAYDIAYRNNYSPRLTRIRYDTTAIAIKGDRVWIALDFIQAIINIRDTFGINFTANDFGFPSETNLLNGAQNHPNHTIPCRLPNNLLCDSLCGTAIDNSDCHTLHHKSATRLNGVLRQNDLYTIRVVGHRLCMIYNGHRRVDGAGNFLGKNSIATTEHGDAFRLRRTIQHELGHNLGVEGHCGGSTNCVMNDDLPQDERVMNAWCASHASAIRSNK
jgi:hypothetical protein